MLYRDYSRKPGEWLPNEYGGRENLEAIAFLSAPTRWSVRSARRPITLAEESTAFPACLAPTYAGGLGFALQVEHGLDARHAEATWRATRRTASTTTAR